MLLLNIFILIIYLIKLFFFFLLKKNFNIKNFSGQIKKKNYNIMNNNGKILNLNKLKLKIFYFGYSQCPDICPKLINKILKKIKYMKFNKKLKFFFFSIDLKDNNYISQNYIIKNEKFNIYSFQLNKYNLESFSLNYKIIYNKLINFINKIRINHSNIMYLLKYYNLYII